MNLLVDTDVFLWWLAAPERLSDDVRAIMSDRNHQLALSAASSWEMAELVRQGRLELPEPIDKFVPSRLARERMTGLPIKHAHVLHAAMLPPHHQDPIDRILVAQALLDGFSLLTADPKLEPYGAQLVWAVPRSGGFAVSA